MTTRVLTPVPEKGIDECGVTHAVWVAIDSKTGNGVTKSRPELGDIFVKNVIPLADGGFLVGGSKCSEGKTPAAVLVKLKPDLARDWEHTYPIHGAAVCALPREDGTLVVLFRETGRRLLLIHLDRDGAWRGGRTLGEKAAGDWASLVPAGKDEMLLITTHLRGEPWGQAWDSRGSRIVRIGVDGKIRWTREIPDVRIRTAVSGEGGGFVVAGSVYPGAVLFRGKYPGAKSGLVSGPKPMDPKMLKDMESTDFSQELVYVARLSGEGNVEWSQQFGTKVKSEMPTVPLRYPGVVDLLNKYVKIWYQRGTRWDNQAVSIESHSSGDLLVNAIARKYDGTVTPEGPKVEKEAWNSLIRISPSGKTIWEYKVGRVRPEWVRWIEGDGYYVLGRDGHVEIAKKGGLEKISPTGNREWSVPIEDLFGLAGSDEYHAGIGSLFQSPGTGLVAIFNVERR